MTSGENDESAGRARDEALAGEYVIGVLPSAERRAVEARMASEPAFAALVAGWQRDLAVLDSQYEPVAPPAALERRITARLFGDTAPTPASGIWGSLAFWRGVSLASLVVAGGLAAALGGLLPLGGTRDAAPLVARMTGDDATIGLVAAFDPGSGALRVVPAAFAPDGERALELWLVPGEGAALSLGVVPEDGGTIVIDPAVGSRLADGALLAVSLEPPGGSPTGSATGPILVTGKLARR